MLTGASATSALVHPIATLVCSVDLSTGAIRLARQLVGAIPHDAEARGLLALMLLADARRPGRVTEHGDLIPLEELDRTSDEVPIDHGVDDGVVLLVAVRPGCSRS